LSKRDRKFTNHLLVSDAGDVRTHAVVAFGHTQGIDIQPSDEYAPTLRVGGSGAAIAHGVSASDDEVAGTLCTNSQGGQRTTDIAGAYVSDKMSVRRLTPVECERLMGWPDRHTAPEGVKAPDSKRYAACGDGIVAPVAFWIADRIRMIEGE
jgi:DNA (cytosine-5)-methyltransferase 1